MNNLGKYVCDKCEYKVFEYARCCPMCGSEVKKTVRPAELDKSPSTRFDFWLAGLRKSVFTNKERRAA